MKSLVHRIGLIQTPRWFLARTGCMFIGDLFERWSCDMCEEAGIEREVWLPLLGRHERRHTAEEWAAAGYDKAGTLRGFWAE